MISAYWTEEKRKNHSQKLAEYYKKQLHWKAKKRLDMKSRENDYPKFRTDDGQLIALNFYPKENEGKWEEFLTKMKGAAYTH